MEEQVEYAPEMPAESPEGTPEEIGEQPPEETAEVEEGGEPTPPAAEDQKEKALLKATQEERRKRQEAKQEAEFWRKVAMGEVENPLNNPPEPAKKPTPEQFESYDDYVEALTDYKAEQAIKRNQEHTQKATREQVAQREEQKLQEKAAADAKKAAEKYPDFFEVAGAVTLPDITLKAMYQSDLGPDIAYYLGKNQTELDRILELSPQRQIMELGKLEVKLAAKAADPQKKVVKQATKVESAGEGFPQPTKDLTKLFNDAKKTGNWTKYLIESGRIPGV